MLTGFTPADVVLLEGCHTAAKRLLETAESVEPANEEERQLQASLRESLRGLTSCAGDAYATLVGRRP